MNLQQLIIELWHTSRIALATQDTSRYNRMLYVKRELLRSYPNVLAKYSPKQLWLEIGYCID
jgi:hypothetical protein